MPEQFHPSQQPETNFAAEQAERLGAGAERQAACADLVGECSETANETPEGRLQLVCAQEGMSLQDVDLAVLLDHPDLRLPFGRPLPMPPRIRTKCVVVLQKELGIEVQEELPPISEAVVERQAILADEVATEGKAATREAELDRDIATTEAEHDTNTADISEIIKTRVSSGNLAHYRAETTKVLESEYDGDALANALAVAEGVFAKHEQKLTAMQAVFTPEEIQRVFGGSLTQTVSLNFRGENNAQIYADIFARIDAGFANDDDRRREVRAAVEVQLGITMHAVERPANASELQSTLRNGRGTEEIREIQRVEEPPGSGNFVEKEVVVGERPLPFTEKDRLVLSINPRISVFPDPPGGVRHRVVGEVGGGKPVHIFINVPPKGVFPAAVVNNRMNEQMQNTVFRNNGMTGVLEYFHGRGDSSLGAASETNFDSVGQNEMTQTIMKTFIGENTTLGGRFITGAELNSMSYDLRHLAPDGDFGAFNQMNPALANSLMTGMFGSGREEIMANLQRSGPFINTGGAETPSYQALYAQMHPEDAAAGYPRLREVIGDNGMAVLNFGKGEEE